MTDKTDNVDYLPIFKKGSTAEEFFYEIAMIARKYPRRFSKFALVYEETLPNGNTLVRQLSYECTTNELIGLLELGKQRVIDETRA